MTAAVVQTLFCEVTFAGVVLPYVFGVQGSTGLDTGYPTCTVTVPVKPATGNEGDALSVVAGAGAHDVTRGTYRVMRFRGPSGNPPTVEIVGAGSLARAEEYVNGNPDEVASGIASDLTLDEILDGASPTGKNIILALLARVATAYPEVTYSAGNFADAGVLLGETTGSAPAFLWKVGQSALDYIREIDRLEGFRTYQGIDGTIRRVQMVGHPDNTVDFTFDATNTLRGGEQGDRNTEETRNWVTAVGYDYGTGLGPVTYTHKDSNPLQDIDDPHPETFSHPMIERWNETDDPGTGYSAQQVAERVIPDVNKEFVRSTTPTYIDDVLGPGQTHLVDLLTYIRVGEPMWGQRNDWGMATGEGWTQRPSQTGGGLQGNYPDVPL